MRGLGPADIGVAATRVNGESRRQGLTMGGDRTVAVRADGGMSRWDELVVRVASRNLKQAFL